MTDTGIDHAHPDLAANVWTNGAEVAGNGIDDDGNGFVDDMRGWDFVDDDPPRRWKKKAESDRGRLRPITGVTSTRS